LIGGSGFALREQQPFEEVRTPYGEAWATEFRLGEQAAVFLPRHGPRRTLPPHRVNYRANLWALKERGVSDIFATFSVGSLRTSLPPGTVIILDQFLDFTKARPATFFDGEDGRIVHVEMTYPYCPRLRGLLSQAAKAVGLEIVPRGTYVCVEGPRFETAAEIAMLGSLGGDVVGMTGVPEVVLARELGICFCGLALVTNFGAGLGAVPPSHQEVMELMGGSTAQIWNLFEEVSRQRTSQACECKKSVSREDK